MAAPYSQNYDGEVTRGFTRGPATLPCFPMYNAQYEWKSCLNGDGRCGSSAPPRNAKCSSLSSQTATSHYIQRHCGRQRVLAGSFGIGAHCSSYGFDSAYRGRDRNTGKELVAQAIHNLSARRERPFVKLNCAAIPFDLLESGLSRHEKGAFTGSISLKIGRFEMADRGTLFLDEIGDLPLTVQPKLLSTQGGDR